MTTRVSPATLDHLRRGTVTERRTLVDRTTFASLTVPPVKLSTWLDGLPRVLRANDLRELVAAVVKARHRARPVFLGLGGHVIKCGLGPWIVRLMEEQVVTGVLMNGGASIHDFELAAFGNTSEDVAKELKAGSFGLADETGRAIHAAVSAASSAGEGLGTGLGRVLALAPFSETSVLAAGIRTGVPVLIHTAIGADTIHLHPAMDPAAFGICAHYDFRVLISLLSDFFDGACYLNLGSAVVLPEVFLKALSAARNLAPQGLDGYITADFDMNRHYRPNENVVRRPAIGRARGYSFTGHHEIMLPLLFALVLEGLHAP